MKKQSLKELLSRRFSTMLLQVDDGYEAWHPELGRWTALGLGSSPEEALEELEAMRKNAIEYMYEEGLPVPEPAIDGKEYSGQFVLRLPSSLHKSVAIEAKQEGVSLNQYLVGLIAQNHAVDKLETRFEALENRLQEGHDQIIRGISHHHESMLEERYKPKVPRSTSWDTREGTHIFQIDYQPNEMQLN